MVVSLKKPESFLRESMESPNNTNISKNCEFIFCFDDLNRVSALDCLTKIQLEQSSNNTDKLVKLLEEGKLISQYDQRSYISINFAFAESLLIMVGLFINLLVSSVLLFS